MDFALPPEIEDLKERTARFVHDTVIPQENDPRQTAHGLTDDFKKELIADARKAGLLSPHVGKEWGGLGLDMRGMAVVFEEAGYSLLGPQALNCAAPDEGNMHLLEVGATEAQKEKWLKPLTAGEIRSCFSMTEPHPGAGSDPN
ncbi:MAG: acyl-CoA dehydrogenase, partial [Rhodospirillaceae bacterium]|nr:acyl-CoA dehydrogenase [Rhodospirillaceae bacterium]